MVDLKVITPGDHTQRAPHSRRNFLFHPVGAALSNKRQIGTFAVLDFVEHNVAFESVGPDDVIVVLVQIAPDDAGPLVTPARDRLKLDRNVDIFSAQAIIDADRKTIISPIGVSRRKDVALISQSWGFHHYPLAGLPSACQ